MTDNKQIRLSHLKISNYKKIDTLEIDFLPPLMQGDPDILVLGSKNGGGKTSVLECCSLLVLAGTFGEKFRKEIRTDDSLLLDIGNLLVKAGQEKAIIEGEFEQNNKKCKISLTIDRDRQEVFSVANIEGNKSLFKVKKK